MAKNVFLSTIMVDDVDNHDGRGHHHRGGSHDSSESDWHRPIDCWESEDDGSKDKDEDDGIPLLWFIIVGDLALVALLLCVCMSCKWYKQKRELAEINAIIADECKGDEVSSDVEGAKSYSLNNVVVVDENKSTVLLNE